MTAIRLDTQGLDIAALAPIDKDASRAKVAALFDFVDRRGREACGMTDTAPSATATATATVRPGGEEAATPAADWRDVLVPRAASGDGIDGPIMEEIDATAEIRNPLSGETIDATDIDGMIDAYEGLKMVNDSCYAAMTRIREALAALTEGDAVTRRVRGKRRQATVTMPDIKWDQSQVKEVWNAYPALRESFLKIGEINVVMKEYKKLVNMTSDQPDFTCFRDMLTAANRGRVGTPTIKIEK